MGNANGREDGQGLKKSNIESDYITLRNPTNHHHPPSDLMENTPPVSPPRSRSPSIFAPQVPVAPLERKDGPSHFNPMWQNESCVPDDLPLENGIPTLITWNYGGNNVAVEGSWDNWRSRKMLQSSGKDYTILLVLASGIYHYKFIVDGEIRYSPDLPSIPDEMGHVYNLLDVHDYVPETLDSVAEFEPPSSPDSSYTQDFPPVEEFAKDPVAVPSQLHLSVLSTDDSDDCQRPQHVVLNHLFIEKGWAPQSVIALGLTHRFQSKYVTVVLYKPLLQR